MLARRVVHLHRIGLVNIVAGEEVAPELLQAEVTPEPWSPRCCRCWDDGPPRHEAQARLARVRERLGTPGASARVAALAAGSSRSAHEREPRGPTARSLPSAVGAVTPIGRSAARRAGGDRAAPLGYGDAPAATWIHAASVGEVGAACAARARQWAPAARATRLVSSARRADSRRGGDAGTPARRAAPVTARPGRSTSRAPCAARSRAARRAACCIVETEIWPRAGRRGRPRRPRRRRQRAPVRPLVGPHAAAGADARAALIRVTPCAAQSEADADRWLALGAPRDAIAVTGNTKFDAVIAASPPAERAAARAAAGLAPGTLVVRFGNLRPGEEAHGRRRPRSRRRATAHARALAIVACRAIPSEPRRRRRRRARRPDVRSVGSGPPWPGAGRPRRSGWSPVLGVLREVYAPPTSPSSAARSRPTAATTRSSPPPWAPRWWSGRTMRRPPTPFAPSWRAMPATWPRIPPTRWRPIARWTATAAAPSAAAARPGSPSTASPAPRRARSASSRRGILGMSGLPHALGLAPRPPAARVGESAAGPGRARERVRAPGRRARERALRAPRVASPCRSERRQPRGRRHGQDAVRPLVGARPGGAGIAAAVVCRPWGPPAAGHARRRGRAARRASVPGVRRLRRPPQAGRGAARGARRGAGRRRRRRLLAPGAGPRPRPRAARRAPAVRQRPLPARRGRCASRPTALVRADAVVLTRADRAGARGPPRAPRAGPRRRLPAGRWPHACHRVVGRARRGRRWQRPPGRPCTV